MVCCLLFAVASAHQLQGLKLPCKTVFHVGQNLYIVRVPDIYGSGRIVGFRRLAMGCVGFEESGIGRGFKRKSWIYGKLPT